MSNGTQVNSVDSHPVPVRAFGACLSQEEDPTDGAAVAAGGVPDARLGKARLARDLVRVRQANIKRAS
jgi:hypothetical protein